MFFQLQTKNQKIQCINFSQNLKNVTMGTFSVFFFFFFFFFLKKYKKIIFLKKTSSRSITRVCVAITLYKKYEK